MSQAISVMYYGVDGRSKHELYPTWHRIMQRCHYERNKHYANYGGRGIRVDPRWHDFWVFAEEMKALGPCPDGYSIDRIDNDGNYAPGNVRWASPLTQANNTRSTVLLTIEGVTRSLKQWGRAAGLTTGCMRSRYDKNWTFPRLFRPSQRIKPLPPQKGGPKTPIPYDAEAVAVIQRARALLREADEQAAKAAAEAKRAKREAARITIEGESLTAEAWAARVGISVPSFKRRMRTRPVEQWLLPAGQRRVATVCKCGTALDPDRSAGDGARCLSCRRLADEQRRRAAGVKPQKRINIEPGERYGRLVTVEKRKRPTKHPNQFRSVWYCHCDCGGDNLVDPSKLVSGQVASCGCREGNRRPER